MTEPLIRRMQRRISRVFLLETEGYFRNTWQFRRARASHDDACSRCEYERSITECLSEN